MKLFRQRRERRLQTPENLERRQQWDAEHQITDPSLHDATRHEVSDLTRRAAQLANIASVVTIRTRPK